MEKLIRETCPMCRKLYGFRLEDGEEYAAYVKYTYGNNLIQDILLFNSFEREFIKSGLCPNCQEILFGNKCTNKERFVQL
jgi:hypothetical protein